MWVHVYYYDLQLSMSWLHFFLLTDIWATLSFYLNPMHTAKILAYLALYHYTADRRHMTIINIMTDVQFPKGCTVRQDNFR
jgi:hypothetical protein